MFVKIEFIIKVLTGVPLKQILCSTIRILLQGHIVKVQIILLHIDSQFRNSFCFVIMYRKSVKTFTSKESHDLIKAQKWIMVSPEIKR